MDTKNLITKRAQAWEQTKALLDNAEGEKRDLTAEESEQFDRMMADIDGLDQRLKAIIEAEQRDRDIAASLRTLGIDGKPGDNGTGEQPTEEQRIRKFLRGEAGREMVFLPEARDLSKGTATAGGNTVPTSFYDQLVEHMIEVSGVLMAGATVLRTTSGENLEVPVTTAFSSGALVAEGAAITESDPAFAKRTLGAYKYGAMIQVTRELLDDTGIDLTGFLARQAGRAVGNAMGVHLVTGTGTSQPAGIATGASTGVTGGAGVAGAFTADNLIDLQYSVISPYRSAPTCAWLFRDATVAAVRKLKDTTNQYIWQPSMQAGTPDVLLGKALYTDPNVAAVALSAKSVLFGDIAAYFVRLAGGVRFERSDEFAFSSDLVTFRCLVRGDGVLADQTGAVKAFVGNAA